MKGSKVAQGMDLLNIQGLNKGTAFTDEERGSLTGRRA